MNLIDLREFNLNTHKTISFDDSGFIFSNTEYEKEVYKRYFYKYNMDNKNIHRINEKGIDTCQNIFYDNYILNDYIYTNSYSVQDNIIENFMCRVNIINGEIIKDNIILFK